MGVSRELTYLFRIIGSGSARRNQATVTRPIKALSVSDGIWALAVRDPPAYAGGFYWAGCPLSPKKP